MKDAFGSKLELPPSYCSYRPGELEFEALDRLRPDFAEHGPDVPRTPKVGITKEEEQIVVVRLLVEVGRYSLASIMSPEGQTQGPGAQIEGIAADDRLRRPERPLRDVGNARFDECEDLGRIEPWVTGRGEAGVCEGVEEKIAVRAAAAIERVNELATLQVVALAQRLAVAIGGVQIQHPIRADVRLDPANHSVQLMLGGNILSRVEDAECATEQARRGAVARELSGPGRSEGAGEGEGVPRVVCGYDGNCRIGNPDEVIELASVFA
jgi:hypothetical protein